MNFLTRFASLEKCSLRLFQGPNSNHHINCGSALQQGGGGSVGIIGGHSEMEEDVWRGHSIAALRRRASELNANTSIPSYLHAHNYDHHNSVY